MSETILVRTVEPTVVTSVRGVETVLSRSIEPVVIVTSLNGETTLISKEQGPAGPPGIQGNPGPPGADGEIDLNNADLDGGNF